MVAESFVSPFLFVLKDLMASTKISDAGLEMVRRGIGLCKGLVEPTETIEGLLVMPRSCVLWKDLFLCACGGFFDRLEGQPFSFFLFR